MNTLLRRNSSQLRLLAQRLASAGTNTITNGASAAVIVRDLSSTISNNNNGSATLSSSTSSSSNGDDSNNNNDGMATTSTTTTATTSSLSANATRKKPPSSSAATTTTTSTINDADIKKSVFISQSNDIFTNLALEDWLYKNFDFSNHHVLLLWANNPCVVIGRHQNPFTEANVSKLVDKGITLARRNSGGGAVYHDRGNLNCTFFTPRERYNRKYNLNIVTRALFREWAIKAEINKRDDIVILDKKISGTAAKLGRPNSYHHCTILASANKLHLGEALVKEDANYISRATSSVRSPIRNLCDVNRNVNVPQLLSAVGYEYLRTAATELEDGGSAQAMQQRGFQLVNPTEKWFPGIDALRATYSAWDWVIGKTPKFTVEKELGLKGDDKQLKITLSVVVEEESTAWKTLTSHPNSLVQLFPARAMRVVQEVVRSLRKDTHVVITTTAGKVRGRYQKYRSGERGGYYSFKGIRYGMPPVGNRRFRAAEPEKPWIGVRDASREGNSCPHKNMILDTFKGDEDCLFLNVFTTRIPKEDEDNTQMPVMVWLHGGGFSFGSGNTFLYGPDYLVAEDVVLVTLNYRLGPFGFLTAGPDAPGNQGLKDQVLALKWVRDNIAAFGGNPKQVTIFGESAGGSSAQLLLLSPMAKGLFHRAISQSGSALNPWSMGASNSERAARLAANLGYVGTNQTEDILEFLRRVSPMKLVEAAPTTLTADDHRNNIGLPFVPVVEGYWNKQSDTKPLYYEPPFMNEHPNEIYQKRNITNDVPYMTGYNTHEAMLFIRRLRKNPQLLQIIENDFGRLVPHDLLVNEEHDRVMRDMRQFYLGSKHVGLESVDEMIALLTDLMFLQGIRRTARNHARYGAPVYMYRFAFDGALGLYKRMLGIPRPGVCHGDEMGYLFKFGFFNLSLDPKSMEVLVKNRMVRMWTNFAKYGIPTPSLDDPLITTQWTPIDPTDVMHSINYLDISATLDMKTNPEQERQQFWDKMYKHYNGAAM